MASSPFKHNCNHHNHSHQQGLHRHYADLPNDKLEAFVVNESSPLTAHTLHQVAHDIHEFNLLKERLSYFSIYILAIVLFMGLNGALLLANLPSQQFIEDHYAFMFHMLSFWGVFLFTLVEAALLISTGVASLSSISEGGTTGNRISGYFSIVILVDVVFSFVSALLYTMDPEFFEVPSHYLEYSIQIPISCVNLMFVEDRILDRQRSGDKLCATTSMNERIPTVKDDSSSTAKTGFFSIRNIDWVDFPSLIPVALSLLQLLLYSGILSTNMSPERASHFCEFLNELLNGMFALQYALRSYATTQRQLNYHHV